MENRDGTDLLDQVARPHPAALGGTLPMNGLDHSTTTSVSPHDEPVPGAADPLDREELRHHVEHPVDRDRKPDPLGPSPHRHVDRDHLAVDVQERAARIAGIDAGVGLDEVVIPLGAAHFDVAVERGDDAAGEGVFVAVGVAEGEHGLPDHEIARGADSGHRQRLDGVDLDDGQVGPGIV